MTKKLQILLYSITVYLTIFGLLFLFTPRAADQFTKIAYDPSLSILYGLYALIFALVAFLAARERQAASKLSLVLLFLLVGHVFVFSYLFITGIQAFAQAGPPIIVNLILAVLLFWFRREK